MPPALYINGIFEGVLDEITRAQKGQERKVCYLQPYAAKKITLLAEAAPSNENQIILYISLTNSLSVVSYRAMIVGWKDKQKLSQQELALLNAHIQEYQPGEKNIYQTVGNGKKCANLISIIELERLPEPVPVSCFIKVTDGIPLQKRSRAGGWSYVKPLPDWLGMGSTLVQDDVDRAFQLELAESLHLSAFDRKKRLQNAPKVPQSMQVLSRAFRRNPDVVAEVLVRANGICERCKSVAPFTRASDGSPYLEVHHRITLATGGEDTVENAIAICPNCHRYLHLGKHDDFA